MPDFNYLLVQMPAGFWRLKLYGNREGSVMYIQDFNKRYEALRVVRLLRLHISANDRMREVV